jgi:hypothetical protein
MKHALTVLVNSTDSFEDCWEPFFRLFSIYWPACPYPCILNTEKKIYSFSGINLTTSQVGKDRGDSGPIPWSDCLLLCIDQIRTEYIIYLQDDYFINKPVNHALIEEFVVLMAKHDVAHVRLMETDIKATRGPSSLHPLLWEISQSASYRISLQAGIWKRDSLKAYLRPGESAWQFERSGTQRSYKKKEHFLCQNFYEFNNKGKYPIPYHPTGIIKGKWNADAVVELFKQNGIVVEYEQRGFFKLDLKRKIIIWFRALTRRSYMRIKWWFTI